MWSGAILEISLRVGVIPLNVTSQHVSQAIFQANTHKEFRSLYKELYLVYFVKNYA